MKSVLILLLGVLVMSVGCDGAKADSTGGKKRVVATTTMIGDLVKTLAGDKVDLSIIVGPGVDPHTYKPSPADMANLGRADLVLYNGLHLEGKMADLLESTLQAKSTAVSAAVPHDRLISADDGGKTHDPHIWFDVAIWSYAAQSAANALIAVDAANADLYRQNLLLLQADLSKLDGDVRTIIAGIPAERRVLITSHDAYNYFGKAYDIQVRGLQGISTESEASMSAVSAAVDFIVERKIPAVFVETSVPHKTIERVISDCRARGVTVKEGGELYSDAMGTPGERPGFAVETYRGMVLYNVTTIANALK